MEDRQKIHYDQEQHIDIDEVNKEITKPNKLEIKNLLLSFEDEALKLGGIVYDKGTKKWYAIATGIKSENPIAIVIPVESGDEGIKLGEKIITKSSSFKPKDIFSNYIQSLNVVLEEGSEDRIENKGKEDRKTKIKTQELYEHINRSESSLGGGANDALSVRRHNLRYRK